MKIKYSAFFSYNSHDKPMVEKITQWLEDNANQSVWLDKWNLIPGDPWQEEIEKALDESLVSLLKVATICPFRGINVQVRIFRLKRAKMPFSAKIFPLGMPFLPFSATWLSFT